jgi:N utilization substance protein B
MQMVYSYHKNGDSTLQRAEKELFHSISKSYELYHFFLLLLLELRQLNEKRIEIGLQKHIPTSADLNPNTKFINNRIIDQLANNRALLRYVEESGLSWVNHHDLIRNLWSGIEESSLYQEYMNDGETSYDKDKRFVIKLIEKVIAPFEPLYSQFEELSIYWNDEAEFIISMVIKTIKEFAEEQAENQLLQPEFKDEEDREFVKTLFRKSIVNHTEFLKLIEQHTKNWDVDRVAFIDIVLMQIALAEVKEFPDIPVRVTLNEYIEIAKFYSTSRSGNFINGVLDKIVNYLIESHQIVKSGKGLKGEGMMNEEQVN